MLGVGVRLLRLVGIKENNGPLIWAFRLGLGWLFWGLLALGLGLDQLFYPVLIRILLIVAFVMLALKDRYQLFKVIWPFKLDSFNFVFGGPVLCVLVLSLANLLSPEMSWDAMTYQLLLPKFYLIHHGFYAPAGMVPAHYPALGQMLFSWGLVWGDDSLARSFSFLAHLATAMTLVGLGNRLESPRVGWLAASLYWIFPYFNIYSTRGYVDLISGFYATLGMGLLLAPKDKANQRQTLLPWVFLGAVWGFKFNAASFWLGGLVIAFSSWRMKSRAEVAAFWGAVLLPTAFFGLPWAMKSWCYTGNPVFPHLTELFSSFGWSDFDARAAAIKFQFVGIAGLFIAPLSLWNLFFDHFSGAPNEEVNPLLLIFAVFPFWRRFRSSWTGSAILGLSVPGVLWLCTSPQLRLISPVIALACLVLGAAAGKAWEGWSGHSRTLRWGFIAVLWLNALSLFQGLFHQPDPLPCFLGLQTRDQFLSQILAPRGYLEVMQSLNQQTSPNARVLITGLQNGYYLERESCFDYGYVTPVLQEWIKTSQSPDGIYLKFKEHGITNWLVNSGGQMSLAIESMGMGLKRYDLSPEELHRYEQFFLHYTSRIPLETGGMFGFYAVHPGNVISDFPEHLPGTESFYAENLTKELNLKNPRDLFGKNLPESAYLAAYRDVARQHPELGEPCFEWAWASMVDDSGSADRAVSIGREGFQRNGDEASYLNLLGCREMIRGHYLNASEYLRKAYGRSPTRESIARNLASVSYHLHDLNQAVHWVTIACQLAPYSEDDRIMEQQLEQASQTTRLLENHDLPRKP